MSMERMSLAEAIKKFEPDSHTAGFKKDGVNAGKQEAIRYYFKNGREVFYHIVDHATYDHTICFIIEGRKWGPDIINAYNWVKLDGACPRESL